MVNVVWYYKSAGWQSALSGKSFSAFHVFCLKVEVFSQEIGHSVLLVCFEKFTFVIQTELLNMHSMKNY